MPLDLAPARWIWFPSRRTLPNTFALFRKVICLEQPVRRATGWVCADSRYRLEVNGRRVQFGPAPADPRWLEADPLDLTDHLTVGENVLGATVLFYGHGDGTSPLGKPGFILRLEVELADGSRQLITTDESWQTQICRAWRPGQYKRWYLRSLQEVFDARLYPQGWSKAGFGTDSSWLPAMPLDCPSDKTPMASSYPDYLFDASSNPADTGLLSRSIPMMLEREVEAAQLAEAFELSWQVSPNDYFDFEMPDAVEARALDVGELEFTLRPEQTLALTFAFPEQLTGWPQVWLEAPEGTTVELLTHEGHEVGGPVLLNTHFNAWSRFVCRAGENRLEPFDFECFRWLQIIIRGAVGKVKIHRVGARRREFPFTQPCLHTDEPALNKLVQASFNTLRNSLQELPVDGMGRERQQYSGDGGHQLHVARLALGDSSLTARHLRTFAMGQTLEGYFLDCWPAYDRMVRVSQRQLGLTPWGPLLDHSVGFVLDAAHYLDYTGDTGLIAELMPRFRKWLEYLERLSNSGLLPVENLGIPTVWLDHDAYQAQRDKQCAFDLYAAAMLEHGLAKLARAVGDEATERRALELSRQILQHTVQTFWDEERGLFVVNKPWSDTPRLCDRSLATAVLYDQCPNGRVEASLEVLETRPPELGWSYPANAVWRMWALARGGRTSAILRELREDWATMPSVHLNNTLSESWVAVPDSHAQWSHCAVAPLTALYSGLAGIQPVSANVYVIRPKIEGLGRLELTAHTARGKLEFSYQQGHLRLEVPVGLEAILQVQQGMEELGLERFEDTQICGVKLWQYRLLEGENRVRFS